MQAKTHNVNYLKECFSYNPETGDIKRIARPQSHFEALASLERSNRAVGRVCGVREKHKDGNTYLRVSIQINGRVTRILAHRLAWMLHYGVVPDCIDHINGNGTDNRLCNLSNGTIADNNRNQRRQKNNTSGVTGVSMESAIGKWVTSIYINNRRVNLGAYDTKAEAIAARKAGEKICNYHKNHGTIKD